MIDTSAVTDGLFIQHAKPGRRLAGIGDFCLSPCDGVNIFMGKGGTAGERIDVIDFARQRS